MVIGEKISLMLLYLAICKVLWLKYHLIHWGSFKKSSKGCIAHTISLKLYWHVGDQNQFSNIQNLYMKKNTTQSLLFSFFYSTVFNHCQRWQLICNISYNQHNFVLRNRHNSDNTFYLVIKEVISFIYLQLSLYWMYIMLEGREMTMAAAALRTSSLPILLTTIRKYVFAGLWIFPPPEENCIEK